MNALRRPGLRFLVEAFVIVLTAVLTGLAHLGAVGIGGAVALVWVVAAVIEYSLSHPRKPKEQAPLVESLPEVEHVPSEAVRVIPRTPAPPPAERVPTEPAPVEAVVVEPEAVEAEPVAVEPEPVAVEPEPVDPEPVEPEPVAPVPVESPPVAAEPVAAAPEPFAGEPRAWNVWELDRALHAADEMTEEQEFLLIYLRDYAGPDGSLPLDFDSLVRESFGTVLGTPSG